MPHPAFLQKIMNRFQQSEQHRHADGKDRQLTSKERSMIQTFPEDFDFEGTKTNVEQMIGNAVPVNLGAYIADAIIRYSGEKRCEKRHLKPQNINHLIF